MYRAVAWKALRDRVPLDDEDAIAGIAHAAALHAGPAVLISFAIAALACLFAGLCYAEFASMIPMSGSAYTYAYATMGEMCRPTVG